MLNVLCGLCPHSQWPGSEGAVSCTGSMSESEHGVEGFRPHPSSSVHDLNEGGALKGEQKGRKDCVRKRRI